MQSPNNCTARSEDRFFPKERKCLLKRRNQKGSGDQLWPAWFCWLVPLETHYILHTSLSSVGFLTITEHQVRIHLTIKDILASLSAMSGLPCTFQFSFTGPMKEIEQNFPGGNAAWLYEQSPFHFRGNQVVFQWIPVTKLFYCYNIMKQFLFCARQGAQKC